MRREGWIIEQKLVLYADGQWSELRAGFFRPTSPLVPR